MNSKWYWVIGLFVVWVLYSNGSLSAIFPAAKPATTTA